MSTTLTLPDLDALTEKPLALVATTPTDPLLLSLFRGTAVLKIEAVEDYEMAAITLKQVKAAQRTVKETQTQSAAPYKATLQAAKIDYDNEVARFETPLTCLANAEATLKRAIGAFDIAERERKAKLEREAEEKRRQQVLEAEKTREAAIIHNDPELMQTHQDLVEVLAQPVAPIVTHEKVSGVVTKEVWKARVIDVALVPDKYITRTVSSAQMSVLHAIAKATKGPSDIPGVEFYRDIQVAASAG